MPAVLPAFHSSSADLLSRWVKNADPDAPPEARASRKSLQFHESTAVHFPEDEHRQRLSMDESGRVGKGKQAAWMKLAVSMPEDALAAVSTSHHGRHHHHGAEGAEGERADSDDDASSEGSSQQSGGHSAFSAALTANVDHEILVDSRRGKVLRKLGVQLGQAKLSKPVEAIKVQTIAALAVLLTIRLLFFLVIQLIIHEETGCVSNPNWPSPASRLHSQERSPDASPLTHLPVSSLTQARRHCLLHCQRMRPFPGHYGEGCSHGLLQGIAALGLGQ